MNRSIPPNQGTKDASGAYTPPEAPKPESPLPSDVDIAELLEKTLGILYREVRSLMTESARGKLHKDSAATLVQYIKTLKELREDELELLGKMTKEELESELAKREAVKQGN